MKLWLNGLDVRCVIGERPDERDREQTLRVDIALDVADAVAESDELSDAVDYAVLARKVREALAAAQCRLIERAARVAAETCAAEANVLAVEAKVTKFGAVEGLESASAACTVRGKVCGKEEMS